MVRVNFLIDGFNLYHSCREAEKALGTSTKWLDIKKMLSSYHTVYAEIAKSKVSLGQIYYFSAFAYHRISNDPDVVERHKAFVSCLKDVGIITEINQFKKKISRCPKCSHQWDKHEEKETDVSMAVKLIELFVLDACDMAVIVSGDTDLAPAVKTAFHLFPQKLVVFAFPYARVTQYLRLLAPGSFKINKKAYGHFQLPDPYKGKNGLIINKPLSW